MNSFLLSNIPQDIQQNTAILTDTIKQIVKDFGDIDTGIEKIKPNNKYFEELSYSLSKVLQILMSDNTEKLFNVLYRIDLPESLIKKAFDSNNPSVELSELIIKRCLQKVILRKKYS